MIQQLRSTLVQPVVLAAVLAAAGAGYFLGSAVNGVSFHTGSASSVEGQISVEADGWTYGISRDVPWLSLDGAWHDGDRPACLPPTGVEVNPLRFAAVQVTVEGSTWRPVVWVDCTHSAVP